MEIDWGYRWSLFQGLGAAAFGSGFGLHPVKVLGIFSGLWAYIIFSVVWSIILRKVLDVQ